MVDGRMVDEGFQLTISYLPSTISPIIYLTINHFISPIFLDPEFSVEEWLDDVREEFVPHLLSSFLKVSVFLNERWLMEMS